MSEAKKNRTIVTILAGICIGLPLIVTIKSPGVGGLLLFIGTIIVYRAIRTLEVATEDSTTKRRTIDVAGKTILVQIVDDFGRELPPQEVEKLLSEARAKANPREMVVPVKFKINSKKLSSS